MTECYRKRMYANYVSSRAEPLAPATLAGLAPRLPYFRQMIRRHIPPVRGGGRILDLGCGHGALIHALRLAGYTQVSGVDGSAEQVAAAQRLGIAGVTQSEALDYLRKTEDAVLDCVVTFDVIEHLTKTELIGFVDEVWRVLRSGGRWIIHVPNGESPFGGRIRYGDLTHELAFTRQSLTQLLRASGFGTVECFEDRPVPHGVKSLVRAVLWRCIRWGWLAYLAVETGVVDRRAIFSQNFLAVAVKF